MGRMTCNSFPPQKSFKVQHIDGSAGEDLGDGGMGQARGVSDGPQC
jgi:hypothetical protein